MAIALIVFTGAAQGADSKGRPTISSGDRALAMMQVQNVFSKHAFYHQVGQHCEELDDIWVKDNGAFGKTATWNLGGNLMQGMEMVRYNYCTVKEQGKKQKLEALSKTLPSVKNVPENLGAGDEYVMHTQETPVIEVAGDGKTAKGIWYSIGLSVNGQVSADGQTSISTGWMWEKYAVDFVNEDGKWKIWHLLSKMDQGPVESGGRGQGAGGQGPGGAAGGGDRSGAPGGGERGGAPAGAQAAGGRGGDRGGQAPGGGGGMKYAGQVEVPRWSPTTAPVIHPKFPEPYYTFSETFSY
jgi:hypothetical protein